MTQSVEEHSASLKKELGVRDLALTQILFIVGLTWIGVAGKLGSSHLSSGCWRSACSICRRPPS